MNLKLKSDYQPTGDQPQAIEALVRGVEQKERDQVLLGVTGSGKTFTMANVIAKTQKPTLVIAHNKTLAAQLYQEFRDFFPDNAVSYFVSYYDYYQPEAYIPSSDTYIEKDSSINEDIDKLRLATTTNLLTRKDVIVIASVSCIYNLGSPVEYGRYLLELMEDEIISRESLLLQLANLQYERSETDLARGQYRLRGDTIQIWPAYEDKALKIDTLENKIESLDWIDPVSHQVLDHDWSGRAKKVIIYPAKHYVVNPKTQEQAMSEIYRDLEQQSKKLKEAGKILEAYRLEQKVKYDLEMIENLGFVNGIENYSRYFDGRKPGDAPFSLLDYFQENSKQFDTGGFLTIIDESHITVPQIRAMYNGDQARKTTLVEYGFRLPSALDNRPLQFEEFLGKNNQFMYVSATPGDWELSRTGGEAIEQIIRPTGLVDPQVQLRPTQNQIEDLIIEVIKRKQLGQRVLVTTLTKKMAEALTEYLNNEEKIAKLVENFLDKQNQTPDSETPIQAREDLPVDKMDIDKIDPNYYSQANIKGTDAKTLKSTKPKVAYLHSDIDTLDRSDILDDLRRGEYDVLVGINLLREGLDLPEVTLVAILDADKEGFLRSETSLVQTMGRAARHSDGQAILYADKLTKSMKAAIDETQRRRHIQVAYNLEHKLTPQTISKPIRDRMIEKREKEKQDKKTGWSKDRQNLVDINKRETIDLSQIEPTDLTPYDIKKLISKLRRRMTRAAKELDYELAAQLRDTIAKLEAHKE